ncbi:MAG TPA: hypothetical protein VFA69_00370 [Candidatus Nitrosotalea sp.]|nr:hypothetical protein [Candidatus Nitrosotalea sp.]
MSEEYIEQESFIEKHSPQTINPDENIVITISSISNDTTSKILLVRVISPNGVATETWMNLQPYSLGFSSKSVIYPNNFSGASTKEIGNYTVLIQEDKTGTLLKSDSFQVNKPWFKDLGTSLLNLPPQIILAIAGGGITFGYNALAGRRDTSKTLLEKKTTNFITHATIYFRIINIGRSLVKSIYTDDVPKFQINPNLTDIRHTKSSIPQQRIDNVRRFYLLIRYLQARDVFYSKLGYNFLDNIRSEKLLSEIHFLISEKLREIFGTIEVDKIKNIIPDESTLTQLNITLQDDNEVKELFTSFEESISTKRLDVVLLLITLYNYQFLYDINRFSKDWYTNKKDHKKALQMIKKKLDNLKNQAESIPGFDKAKTHT